MKQKIIFSFFTILNILNLGSYIHDFIEVYFFKNKNYPPIGAECIDWCWYNESNFVLCFILRSIFIFLTTLSGFYYFKKRFYLSLILITLPTLCAWLWFLFFFNN